MVVIITPARLKSISLFSFCVSPSFFFLEVLLWSHEILFIQCVLIS